MSDVRVVWVERDPENSDARWIDVGPAIKALPTVAEGVPVFPYLCATHGNEVWFFECEMTRPCEPGLDGCRFESRLTDWALEHGFKWPDGPKAGDLVAPRAEIVHLPDGGTLYLPGEEK